ncbi:PAS domain-containing protein [Cohnella yongneupensis]|uniref:PAS domain-containing protein n=1 Tax=Cohnella yongneupensis TaxID=425006 RepID=A0ABW0QVD0_9BACL
MREERFRRIFNATPFLIALRSMKDKRYINVNESFLTTIGLPINEVINQTADLLHYIVDTDDQGELTSNRNDPWTKERLSSYILACNNNLHSI